MPADALQQPCSDCGECVRACPQALDPQALFFALVGDDFAAASERRMDACTECDHCVATCPSHIPLTDWFRWGKSELRERAYANAARQRFAARNTRLAREREARTAQRHASTAPATLPGQTISHAEVLAAIARGRSKYVRSSLTAAATDHSTHPGDKHS